MMTTLTQPQRKALEQAATVAEPFAFHSQHGTCSPSTANLRVLRRLTELGLLQARREWSVSGSFTRTTWHITADGRAALGAS